MKAINWPEMSHHDDNKIDALNEFLVRLDELNANAEELDPVVVARRMFLLVDNFVDVMYPGREESGELEAGGPQTAMIYQRLFDQLKADSEKPRAVRDTGS